MVRENSKTQAKASVYMEGRIPIEGERLGEYTVVPTAAKRSGGIFWSRPAPRWRSLDFASLCSG